jgi:hypothetical protein
MKAMAKAKPEPEVSLADRIKQARAEAEAFIETKAREVKAQNPLVSIDWIRLNLAAVHRTGGCSCRLALKLLDENK